MILAFLQNQWFKNPRQVEAIFERHPDKRHDLIRRFLFAGCLTGKRLQAAFGEHLCRRIVWENASRAIGDHSAARFTADMPHIEAAIRRFNPSLIICFGRVAGDAVEPLALKLLNEPRFDFELFYAPHPAARRNPQAELKELADEIGRRTESRG